MDIRRLLHLGMAVVLAWTFGSSVHALTLQGEWQQGGVLMGKVEPGSDVKLDGQSLRVSPDGHFVFGIGRDEEGPVELAVKSPDGNRRVEHFTVARREYVVQKVEGVQEKHVSPPDHVLERIAQEAAKVRKARELDAPRTDFLQKFVWPLVGPITGVYGSQRVYNGVPKSPHYGLDIAAPIGTKVVAPAAGVVTLAEPDLYYSGGTLILDHGHGFSSTFIHLHKVLVAVGDRVKQGEPIAEVGATGRVTGPHLDWRINWFDVRMDPALLMKDIPMAGGN